MSSELLGPWLLVASRLCGFSILFPSTDGVHALVRIVLAMITAFAISGGVLGSPVSITWGAIGAEFLAGILLSIPAIILLESIASAGEYFDAMRGQLIGNIQDPISMTLQSSSAVAARLGATAIFVSGGVLEAIIQSVASSYELIPCGIWIGESPPTLTSEALITAAFGAFVWPLSTIALLGAVCLVVELVAAGAARLANGAYVSELQFAIKTAFGSIIIVLLIRADSFTLRVSDAIHTLLFLS